MHLQLNFCEPHTDFSFDIRECGTIDTSWTEHCIVIAVTPFLSKCHIFFVSVTQCADIAIFQTLVTFFFISHKCLFNIHFPWGIRVQTKGTRRLKKNIWNICACMNPTTSYSKTNIYSCSTFQIVHGCKWSS